MPENPRLVCSLLNEDDYEYLAAHHGESVDFVRGLTDTEWCHYLGCELEELVYYLLDTEHAYAGEELLYDSFNEVDSFDDDEGFPIDLDLYIQDILDKPVKPYTPVYREAVVPTPKSPTLFDHNYSKPSAFASRGKKARLVRSIPHHFELVR